MKIINWGIIGPGNIAAKFAEAVKLSENAQVIACASQSVERAAAFKEKYALKYAYSSYEELADNPEIDAVYIANTHNFHYESAKICLTRKKAVLCEKAFTVNAAQARELMRLAKENDVFIMEAMWTRFLPAIAWVREQIANGEIGEVIHVEASYSFKAEFNPASRLYDKALAGGCLLDLGIYPVSFACMILGTKPIKISSIGTLASNGVDDMGIVTLLYDGKKTALIQQGLLYAHENDAVIYGSKGVIRIPKFSNAQSASLTCEDGRVLIFDQAHENGFVFEVAEATNMILKGEKESSILPILETVEILELCDKLRADWGVEY